MTEEVETVEIDIEALTLLQVSVLEEYTGLNKSELIKALEKPLDMPMKITIAMIAIKESPADPAAGLHDAEQMKVVDL